MSKLFREHMHKCLNEFESHSKSYIKR